MKWIHVLRREYLENIRKKSFIIGTIVAPIILIGLYSIPILSVLFVPNEQITVAILDRTGLLGEEFIATLDDSLKNGDPKYIVTNYTSAGVTFDDRKTELVKAISDDRLDVLIEIPEGGIESGRINYISKDVMNENVIDRFRDGLNPIVIAARFATVGLDSEKIEELTRRIRMNETKITKSGVMEEQEVVGEMVIVVVYVMMLYVMLLSWGIAIMKSIIEEKSSRVIEVMLSSLEPKDLFIGKILGLGALGFTQVAIWMVMMFGVSSSLAVVATQLTQFVSLDLIDIAYFIMFFVLGFLFYSSMFSIIGAACSTEQDAQQLQMFAMAPLIISVMMMFLVIQNPNSTVAVVISLIPLFTPMLMLARVIIADPPLWQVLLSVVLLLLTTYGVIWIASRVYRVGVLMYGKRPSLKEIVRWTRFA
jgi:ABC-2 type transport system permease protein